MADFHIKICPGRLELAQALRCAHAAGLRFAGLTISSGGELDAVIKASELCRKLSLYAGVEAVAGVEFCHVPPALIPEAVKDARKAGIAFVAVYGESLIDHVEQGTNFSAIDAGADLITHPGLIDEECARAAAEKGTALEFTSAPGHSLSNAHTAGMALRHSALLVKGSGASDRQGVTARAHWPLVVKGSDVFGGEPVSRLSAHLKKSEELLRHRFLGF